MCVNVTPRRAPCVARDPRALDAAQPFDFEAKQRQKVEKKRTLKIGIVGFGNFGQFLAKRFIKNGHDVIATSRSDYGQIAASLNVGYYRDPDDFCEMHPDVVIFCTSILSTEATINAFPMQRLRRNTLVADVLSVKQFPKQLFLQRMPDNFDILCLHPMFGPDSGKGSWKDLPLVYDKVRVGEEKSRRERVDRLLSVFADEGCRMVEMSCEEHDIQAASSQFITHTVGRMLGTMELTETTINTKGYESLLSLVNNTSNDSFDLYYGLFMYNKNATAELSRLELAFSQVKAQLFDRLHTLIRDDIFEDASQPSGLRGAGDGDAKSEERTFKDRLIDQVNVGGSLGGSTDEKGAERAGRGRDSVSRRVKRRGVNETTLRFYRYKKNTRVDASRRHPPRTGGADRRLRGAEKKRRAPTRRFATRIRRSNALFDAHRFVSRGKTRAQCAPPCFMEDQCSTASAPAEKNAASAANTRSAGCEYFMCSDISSRFTTITATMISPTFCSRSSMELTLSHASFFSRRSRTSPSRLERARNSSNDPKPNTRHTMPSRKRSSAPTAADTKPTALFCMNAPTAWIATSFMPMAKSNPESIKDATTPSSAKAPAATSVTRTKTYSNFSFIPIILSGLRGHELEMSFWSYDISRSGYTSSSSNEPLPLPSTSSMEPFVVCALGRGSADARAATTRADETRDRGTETRPLEAHEADADAARRSRRSRDASRVRARARGRAMARAKVAAIILGTDVARARARVVARVRTASRRFNVRQLSGTSLEMTRGRGGFKKTAPSTLEGAVEICRARDLPSFARNLEKALETWVPRDVLMSADFSPASNSAGVPEGFAGERRGALETAGHASRAIAGHVPQAPAGDGHAQARGQ